MAATTASVTTVTASVRSVLRGRRRWPRLGAIVLVAVFLGTGLWLLRWSGGNSRATPDTFWYARDSFRHAGYSARDADAIAARLTCQSYKRVRPKFDYAGCLRYRTNLPRSAPIRFQRIFTSRPGYALSTVPFVLVFGRAGFAIGSAAIGVACGVAIVLLALAAGMRLVQAFLAETLFYLLPTGLWASRLLAEAPMMLCLIASLIGALLLLGGPGWPGRLGGLARRDGLGGLGRPGRLGGSGGRRIRGLAPAGLLAAGLTCLCAVKPANGVALAAVFVVMAVACLPFARARRAYLPIAAVATVVLAGNLLVSAALRLPGVHETLQDAFTHHFHRPDVSDPWQRLGDRDHELLTGKIATQLLNHPFIAAMYVFAAIGLFRWLRPGAAGLLSLAGLTGAMVIAMHPITTETARLTVVTWIPVALGLAALVGPRPRRRMVPPRALPGADEVSGLGETVAPSPALPSPVSGLAVDVAPGANAVPGDISSTRAEWQDLDR
jgi:hypothetical protein